MGSHQLTIAKASLAAACMRPDPNPVPRDQVNAFYELFDAVVNRCSTDNVERCKRWMIANIVQSQPKTIAVGKFLAAVSTSLNDEARDILAKKSYRKHVHMLYLVHDLIHGVKFHVVFGQSVDALSQCLAPFVTSIFVNAAAYKIGRYPKHHSRLSKLLDIWQRQQYFSTACLHDVVNALTNEDAIRPQIPLPTPASQSQGDIAESKKEQPFEMPATHGDPTAAYCELPVAAMLPHIAPNRNTPIDPRQMTVLHFKPGAADKKLVAAVKDFLRDADILYGLSSPDDMEISVQLDNIGQVMYQDKSTGEAVRGESYYGWSKQFCEKMKISASESASPSRSRGRGRRRDARRHSRSISSSRSLSRSYGRSLSADHRVGSARRRMSGQGARSPVRSRSRSSSGANRYRQQRRGSSSDKETVGLQRSQVAPEPLGLPGGGWGNQPQNPHFQPPLQQGSQQLPFPLPSGIPLGPDGLPLPPPRPPNWVGPWPPIPPPAEDMPPPPFGQFPGIFQRPPGS